MNLQTIVYKIFLTHLGNSHKLMLDTMMNEGRPSVYRPLDAQTNLPVALTLSGADRARVESGATGHLGVVTDVRTGCRYRAFNFPCGLPDCPCGAFVIAMPPEDSANGAG